MKKIAPILYLLFIVALSTNAQNNSYISLKYRNAKIKKWEMYSKCDYLLEENKYYSFKITKIIAMRDGYLIRATTKVNKKKVSVVIVSPSESNKQCIKNLNALQLKKKIFLVLTKIFSCSCMSYWHGSRIYC